MTLLHLLAPGQGDEGVTALFLHHRDEHFVTEFYNHHVHFPVSDPRAFFDDRWPGLAMMGPWSVAGGFAQLLTSHAPYDGVVVAIGVNPARLALYRQLESAGARVCSIVHPSATVSRFATIGGGSVICAGEALDFAA